MKFKPALFLVFISMLIIPQLAIAQDSEEDLKYRKWRITLFPPLSTNGVKAPNYTARYSINILGGYHGALDGFEIGGIINYNKEHAYGLQIAGGANISGDNIAGVNIAGLANIAPNNLSGVQIAGLTNFSGDDLEGIHFAGLLNYASGISSGIQFAGFGNISKQDIGGLQAAGIANATLGDISGLQFAGVANIAKNDVEGLQSSGFLNFAGKDLSGLQISGAANVAIGDIQGLMVSGGVNIANKSGNGLLVAGVLNYARELQGLTISGGVNLAEELDGLQVAGFVNAAKEASGLQVGLVNLARKFEGVPVGFISLYGNGRKNVDVRYSDAGFTNIGINLGTYRIYNMPFFGYNTLLDRNVYRIGWAIGLEKNIQEVFPNFENNSIYVNQEFSAAHHFEEKWSKTTNLIYSYKYLFGKRFASGFSVYAGPSINMQVTRIPEAADYTWYSFWSPSAKGRQYRFWVGFDIGIRLFKQKELPLFKDMFNGWESEW